MRIWCLGIFLFLVATHSGYAQSDTTVTTSGLKYVVLQRGQGAYATKGAKVAVHFTGKFKDGRIFDTSSLDKKPVKLHLGRGEVIPAWEEILLLMQVGTKLMMAVPARLGYGETGLTAEDDSYKVPPNTDLVFEMELVDIKK